MNKNKRKLNKLSIVLGNRDGSPRILPKDLLYITRDSIREGDVYKSRFADSYLLVSGGHLRYLSRDNTALSIAGHNNTHDHWLHSEVFHIGTGFTSLEEVARVFL